MRLNLAEIQHIKEAVEKVGDFGKVTLCITDGILLDIVTEERNRVHKPEGNNGNYQKRNC